MNVNILKSLEHEINLNKFEVHDFYLSRNSFFLFCDQEKKKVQDQMPSATWNHPKMEETSTKDYFVVSSAFVDNLWDVKVMPCSA